jgi:hypothetical protein
MNETTESLRLVLAAILVLASGAKLLDLRGAREAVRSFGAPTPLALPVAIGLAGVEAAIAGLLIPAATARLAALAAAALFASFAVVVAVARLRGRTPDCHCFGRLHSAPAGWPIVARNAALATIAAVIASRRAAPIRAIEVVAVAVGALVLGQAILSVTLLRRYGRALGRIEELEARSPRTALEVGAYAPPFTLPADDGPTVTLEGLLTRRRPVLLVFSGSDCGSCRALLPKVVDWQERLADELTVMLVEDEPIVADWYSVEATPSAVLVGTDGKIAHALVAGGGAIEELVRSLALNEEPTQEPATNGGARVAAAAALAGGLAVTTAAQAAPPTDPELQAIDAALKAAEPRLVAASQRSLKAIRAWTTLKTGKPERPKREAARKALAAERHEVLALQATIDKLPATGPNAHNVKVITDNSFSLLAQSLAKRRQAIDSPPKTASALIKDAQELFLQSLASSAAAGKLLGRG